MNIGELLKAAGSPLDAVAAWDPATRNQIIEIAEAAVAESRRRWPDDPQNAVAQTLLGLYAHAFLVGRDHARLGLPLPNAARRGLDGLTLEDLSGVIIPNDIRNL